MSVCFKTCVRRRLAVLGLGGLVLSGCVSTFGSITLKNPSKATVPPVVEPSAQPNPQRTVQAVALESNGMDGQASWMIEQDVPRIPKIAGLDAQLPPHIQRRMGYAFDLAQRGATFSANEEFRAVLGLCALELDAKQGGTSHRDALRQGLVALDEADEFNTIQIDWRNPAELRRAVSSHATPVLAQTTQMPADAIQASQAYYAYAEQRLAFACEGMPAASLAYYGLGRTLATNGGPLMNAAGKAALLQRVALAVSPQNVLAGNELGVLLAQHGHLPEAERLFQQCVATNATPESWRNLSVVYARQGNDPASRAAAKAGEALAATTANATGANGTNAAAAPAAVAAGDSAKSAAPPAEATAVDEKPGLLARLKAGPELPKLFRR